MKQDVNLVSKEKKGKRGKRRGEDQDYIKSFKFCNTKK